MTPEGHLMSNPVWNDRTPAALLIGATGVVGRQAALRLRQRQPDVPILVASRDLDRADVAAAELGNARGVTADLSRPDLGLPVDQAVGAVAMFVKDDNLNGQAFAQVRNAGFVEISSAAFEIAPQAALYAQYPAAAPIVLASNWLAGASTFAAIDLAGRFSRVDSVLISALLDVEDIGGPAADADYDRQTNAGPSGLVRRQGTFAWVSGDSATGTLTTVDGRHLDAQVFGNLDVLSVSMATGAPDVVFQFAAGETSSRRRGFGPSHEIHIDIAGTSRDGHSSHVRRTLVHPQGQAPMTGLGVSLALEALLGRTGDAPAPGLYFPHTLIDSTTAVAALREIGTVITDVDAQPAVEQDSAPADLAPVR